MRNKRIISTFVAVWLMLMLLPMQAFAAGSIDLEHNTSLTISYQDGGTALKGTSFFVYQVATVDECGELATTSSFSRFHVDIPGKNDEAWKRLASTLEGYVLRDNIKPIASGKTDINGILCFEKLPQGLYLVLGARHTQSGRIYESTPFMTQLPTLEKEANDWLYDVIVSPKQESRPIPDDDVTITRKVLKVWEDDEYEKERPKEVIIQLLQNGKVFDTVTLNQENNWRHTWNNLDDDYSWNVVEKELDNYTVEVTQEGVTYVVTNHYITEITDDPVPGGPAAPSNAPQPTMTPINPPQPTTPPSNPPKPTTPGLPQTGQLWWPVPVLIFAGLLLVVIGLFRKRGGEGEE